MGCPSCSEHEALRDQRGRLLQAVRTLGPSNIVRGQFQGYRQEPGVAADSQVETFAAVEFHIETERWSGVPFFVRVGKRLPVTATEVLIRFKHAERPVLDEVGPPLANYFRFQLSPEVVLALGTKVKRPGDRLAGERRTGGAPSESRGRGTLRAASGSGGRRRPDAVRREDAVEESWRIVNPILDNVTPLHEYPPGTWGPPDLYRLLGPDEGWRDPVAAVPARTYSSRFA